jgi:hypothetical protein
MNEFLLYDKHSRGEFTSRILNANNVYGKEIGKELLEKKPNGLVLHSLIEQTLSKLTLLYKNLREIDL